MIAGCQRRRAYWIPTDSPGCVQGPRSRGYWEIRRLGLFGWPAVKKNGVRRVWDSAPEFLRSEGSADSRPVVRGAAQLPGGGDPPGSVSPVRHGEAGKVSLAGDQPGLHEAICLVYGAPVPRDRRQGGGEGAHARLEDREEPGAGVYARATPATGTPGPKAIGIDEISIKKGHAYRIVVSDLVRRRPIWFGGVDRSEQSMDLFYEWVEAKKTADIQLAVMDMWRAFEPSTVKHAPQAAILYDKFHVMRHLGKALDTVRKQEYTRLADKDRSFIKGPKYTLLSRKKNLTLAGRKALTKLLAANKRLHTAYLLKESFGQLWEYQSEGWARRFFENWKASLKWQRLKSYEDFAEMLERHWDGIAAYAKPQNNVSLGFVAGLNSTIRVIHRRAHGLRDEEYLRLKVLTCMLKPI